MVDLVSRAEFLGGLLSGAAALAFVKVAGLGRGEAGWGVATAATTIAATYATFGRRLGLTIGLLILMLGGWLLQRGQSQDGDDGSAAVGWIVAIVGAVVVTVRGGLPGSAWIQFGTPAFILLFGYWLSRWRTLPHQTLLGPLFAISAFGIWVTVPETSTARILLGSALVLQFATLRFIDLRVSLAGAFVVAATVGWIAGDSGAARPGSIIGAWGAAGVLVLIPWAVELGRTVSKRWIVAIHVGLVFMSTRVFGLWESAANAALGVGLSYLLVLIAILLMVPRNPSTALRPTERKPGSAP